MHVLKHVIQENLIFEFCGQMGPGILLQNQPAYRNHGLLAMYIILFAYQISKYYKILFPVVMWMNFYFLSCPLNHPTEILF